MKHLAIVLACLALAACDGTSTANDEQIGQQENSAQQALNSVGFPAITHFTEMRNLKNIYELRDQSVTTFTYITDLYGHLHFVCNSIGYGIPYSTEYLPPTKTVGVDQSGVEEPVREPNGLFPPSSAAGTWVQCLNPQTKQVQPQYIEPDVVVTTYQLQTK